MSNNCINIPIIPYGLRQEETIVQIAISLSNIDSVVTDVFQQIENNIEKHREYLSKLQKRSKIVAAKVDKLAGRKIATTVYSHHKFPSEENNFDTLFKINLKNLDKKPKVPIKGKIQLNKYNKTSKQLHFYHVQSKNHDLQKDEELILKQGLGNIPSDLENVSSLLLFNTCENLYKNYVMRDPLSVSKTYQELLTDDKNPTNDIAAAPNSMVNHYACPKNENFSCFYTPAYEEVPNINLPLNLPDLPGIADDLKFNINLETSIAPSKQSNEIKIEKTDNDSATNNLIVPENFELSLTYADIAKSAPISKTSSSIVNQQSLSNIQPPATPPAPPPFPDLLKTLQVPHPPPPPPLPPPVPCQTDGKLLIASATHVEISPNTSKATNSFDNMHANLMEAIRNAGGKEKARLRPVTETDEVVPETPAKGSLMADLYAKLALRRKGISGVVKEGKNVSMMDRMSALIPPSPPNDSESEDDVANDWDE